MAEERTFHIGVRERVVGYRDVTYEVNAENFDDALEKYHDGYADWYDDDGVEVYDCEDTEVNEVKCAECYETETYCTCAADEDDEDDDDEDDCDCEDCSPSEPENPDADAPGTKSIHDLRPGDVFEAADQYTWDNYFITTGPCVLTRTSAAENGRTRVEFVNSEGYEDYWWVNENSRFRDADMPDNERVQARVQEQLDSDRRKAEASAVETLLFGGTPVKKKAASKLVFDSDW